MNFTAEKMADSLEEAADYLTSVGWCQHKLTNHDVVNPEVCVVGALRWTVIGNLIFELPQNGGGHSIYQAALANAIKASLRFDGIDVPGVSYWNDEAGREKFEVIDLLQKTAKRVRHGDLEFETYA